MSDNLHELFRLATRYFYKKYKDRGGSQERLSDKLGVTQSYISAIMNGARSASLELQNQIANILYGPYDEFLTIGRRIRDGLDPEINVRAARTDDNVESLIARLSHYVIDHQRIEKELVQSREKFRDISLTTADMIFEMNSDMQFTFLAGKVQEVTGRSEEEMLGRNPMKFLDKDEEARIQVLVDASIKDRTILDCVVSPFQNNVKKYRHLIAMPVFDDKGIHLGFRGTYKDITRQVVLQEKLEEKTWLLQEAMESTDWVALSLIDRDNKIIQYNKTYKKFFDIPQEVLDTRNPSQYFAHIRKKMVNPVEFERITKEVLSKPKRFVHEFDLVDGRRIRRVALPLFRDGELAGRHIIIYDVTEETGAKDSRVQGV